MALGLARVRNWGREAQEGALALALARGRLTYQVRSAGRGAALDERLFPVASFNGVPRECFRTAGLLALSNPELTYVEGVAVAHVIPTAHAWCVTPEGIVVDPTWANPEEAAYIGIPFKTAFLKRRLADTEVWGIIGEHIPPAVHAANPSSFLAERWAASVGLQATDKPRPA